MTRYAIYSEATGPNAFRLPRGAIAVGAHNYDTMIEAKDMQQRLEYMIGLHAKVIVYEDDDADYLMADNICAI